MHKAMVDSGSQGWGSLSQSWGSMRLAQQSMKQEIGRRAEGRERWDQRSQCSPSFLGYLLRPVTAGCGVWGPLHCSGRGLSVQGHPTCERQLWDNCQLQSSSVWRSGHRAQSSPQDQLSCAPHSEGHTVPRSLCCLYPLRSSARGKAEIIRG